MSDLTDPHPPEAARDTAADGSSGVPTHAEEHAQYRPMAERIARRFLRRFIADDPHRRARLWQDLADFFQEAHLALWRAVLKCPPGVPREGRRGYAARAVWNRLKGVARRVWLRQWLGETSLPDEEAEGGPGGAARPAVSVAVPACRVPGPESQARSRELAEALGRAFDRLRAERPHLYLPAKAHYLRGRTTTRIGLRLWVTKRTVEGHLQEARRGILSQVGLT